MLSIVGKIGLHSQMNRRMAVIRAALTKRPSYISESPQQDPREDLKRMVERHATPCYGLDWCKPSRGCSTTR